MASNSSAPLNTQDFDGSSRTLLRRLGSIVAGACVFVVLALTGLPVAADTEIPMVKLGPWSQGLKVGATMNAQGVRLWGCKFVGQDLSGANFDGCCLGNVIFEQCDLSDATFRDTVLTGHCRECGKAWMRSSTLQVEASRLGEPCYESPNF